MNTKHIQFKVPLNFEQLIYIVGQLSPREKEKLSSVLWDETREEEIVIPDGQKKTVKHRMKRMEEHPENYLSWEDIEHKIKL